MSLNRIGLEFCFRAGVCLRWNHYFDLSLMTQAMGMPYRLITWWVSRRMTTNAWAQGMGRHSLEEIEGILNDDLQAISDFIGEAFYLQVISSVDTVNMCITIHG